MSCFDELLKVDLDPGHDRKLRKSLISGFEVEIPKRTVGVKKCSGLSNDAKDAIDELVLFSRMIEREREFGNRMQTESVPIRAPVGPREKID